VNAVVARVAATLAQATRREWCPVPALEHESSLQFSDGAGTLAQVALDGDGLYVLRQNERNGFVRAEYIHWADVESDAVATVH